MYASIRKYQTRPGGAAELIQKVREEFVPRISSVTGFVAYYVVDAGDDVVASVSVFQSQAQAEDSTRMAADWVKESVGSLITGPPEITAGSVPVHKTA